jgi:nicotinamidase-related amidase
MGDLHGNAPDRSNVVLLLIDVINDLEFPGGDELAKRALPMAQSLSLLADRARKAGVAVIYANDNFGKWRSDFHAQLRHCLDEAVPGRPIAKLLRPTEKDYFVLKPKHSAFYSTVLELLLRHLEARTLVLTGITAESCVLFTANDAYLRDYEIIVPPDCVVSQSAEAEERALAHMGQILKAKVCPSTEIVW